MKRNRLFCLAVAALLSIVAPAAFAAEPSLHEVYQAVEAGQFKQAQTMMDQVLRDHPNSAKAHFVEAELLAKQGQVDMARAELGTAERLAPGLPFAKPEAVESLKRHFNSSARITPTATPIPVAAAASNFPWGLLIGGLVLIAGLFVFMRSRRQAPFMATAGSGYMPAGSGYAPGFGAGNPQGFGGPGVGPVGPASGGMGSGILGGLATGAALGAGMIAGEALMHRVLDGGEHHAGDAARFQPSNDDALVPDANYDVGGNDFGVTDGGSWDSGSSDSGGGDWS